MAAWANGQPCTLDHQRLSAALGAASRACCLEYPGQLVPRQQLQDDKRIFVSINVATRLSFHLHTLHQACI